MAPQTTYKRLRKYVVGRRIVDFRLRPFAADHGGGRAFNPLIVLDDGTRIAFITQETEVGEYGVYPQVVTEFGK